MIDHQEELNTLSVVMTLLQCTAEYK